MKPWRVVFLGIAILLYILLATMPPGRGGGGLLGGLPPVMLLGSGPVGLAASAIIPGRQWPRIVGEEKGGRKGVRTRMALWKPFFWQDR